MGRRQLLDTIENVLWKLDGDVIDGLALVTAHTVFAIDHSATRSSHVVAAHLAENWILLLSSAHVFASTLSCCMVPAHQFFR